jgi:hypothetical protein
MAIVAIELISSIHAPYPVVPGSSVGDIRAGAADDEVHALSSVEDVSAFHAVERVVAQAPVERVPVGRVLGNAAEEVIRAGLPGDIVVTSPSVKPWVPSSGSDLRDAVVLLSRSPGSSSPSSSTSMKARLRERTGDLSVGWQIAVYDVIAAATPNYV